MTRKHQNSTGTFGTVDQAAWLDLLRASPADGSLT